MVLQKFDDDDDEEDYFLPAVTMIRAEGGLKIIIIYAVNSIEPEDLKHNKLRKRTAGRLKVRDVVTHKRLKQQDGVERLKLYRTGSHWKRNCPSLSWAATEIITVIET